jgi:hypothetical protein
MAYTTINKPSEYFNTKLYTGNGATQSITGVGFQPDWIWIKRRNASEHHCLEDVLRGAGYSVRTSGADAQQYRSTDITSFDSDGFSLGSNGEVNINSGTFVSWNWLANGAGVSNTDGDVTATVSANQTSGFSIVKYVNPASGSPFTVGHGLGSPPKMVITKNISTSQTWGVWHTGIGFGNYIRLDSTAAPSAANLVTATSNTTFSTYQNHHSTGNEIIAYCFAEKKGFSKFGSYTGNGNADGTFVYTGFKPAYVLTKRTDGSYIWSITDGVRNPYNPTSLSLQTEYADAESGWSPLEVDFLSNGFKLRTSSAQKNGSGSPFIYMAFAEEPLVGTNNIPATAR